MRKILSAFLTAFLSIPLAAVPFVTDALVVVTGPTSLVTAPVSVRASSTPVGLFEFALSQDAGEQLSSVRIRVNNVSSATSTDIAQLAVYKDTGDNLFNPSVDALSGSTTTVNLNADTIIQTTSNNTITGSKFYVSLSTSNTWSSTSTLADMVTASFPANGITATANSPLVTAATTNLIVADTQGPALLSVVAKDTALTPTKTAGDTLEFTFSEPTNKPIINLGNVSSTFLLNNGHSFIDGTGALGTSTWNSFGTVWTLTLSASTTTSTIPSAAIGDTVTVTGTVIQDSLGQSATGTVLITGTFGTAQPPVQPPKTGTKCSNGLINGRLYRMEGDSSGTTYLAAACRLKVFKGRALGVARGKKFQAILTVPQEAVSTVPPVIASVSPTRGASGTTITLRGTGFSKTNNSVKISRIGTLTGIASPDGTSLQFTLNGGRGVYSFSVQNANGTSQRSYFVVTGPKKAAPAPAPTTSTQVTASSACANGLVNGMTYKAKTQGKKGTSTYIAENCTLQLKGKK